MRAGLYARVSTREQAEEGYSIDAQLEAMRRYCEAQEGWSVVAEYIDPGVSGTTGERPGLQAALADCKAGKIDVLLTHKLDRLFRNLKEMLNAVDELEAWEVAYVSVVENIDRSTPHGKLLFSQLGSVAQYFSDNLSRETRKGKRGRAKHGRSNASFPPHGYKRVEGKDVIDPDAARATLLAFELYATGRHSDQDIADLLKQHGYKPNRYIRSGRWTRDTIQHMLSNRFYIGEVRYHDRWLPGEHEPLISKDLFDQAQTVREDHLRGGGGGGSKGHVYLLSKIVRCCHCGRRMHTARIYGSKRVLDYYRDSAAIANVECPAAGRHVPQEIIDAQVGQLVKRLALPEDWRERLAELAEHREERENVQGQRTYLRGKLRRLRELYLDGDFDKAEYKRRKEELQTQLAALQVPEQDTIEEAGETLEELGAIWASAPKRIQRDMLKVIFEVVIIDPLERRLVCVKPYPQFAVLFRLDGLKERDGCFYVGEEEKEAGPED